MTPRILAILLVLAQASPVFVILSALLIFLIFTH